MTKKPFTTAYVMSFSNANINDVLKKIDVDYPGITIMSNKAKVVNIFIKGLDVKAANIMKQEFLAAGADLAISKNASMFRGKKTDAIAIASLSQYRKVISKLKVQPFGIPVLANYIENILNNIQNPKKISLLPHLYDRPLIMGILNVTPDSFYDGGKYFDVEHAISHGIEMLLQGADIVDVGGMSSRPGAEEISCEEELNRTIPVIDALNNKGILSIDTMHPEVADSALVHGAKIINDITGFKNYKMVKVAKKRKAIALVMHMKGDPKTMQKNPVYEDVVTEIYNFFEKKIKRLNNNGINDIILDPGIGFGKTLEHNITILKNIYAFKSLGYPVMIGISRKSFIGKITGKDVHNRLYGSIAVESYAFLNGVDIARVHDVAETIDVFMMLNALKK
ncbi:MAG: dihydropteroate synthase [Thermoplasmata archaeon]